MKTNIFKAARVALLLCVGATMAVTTGCTEDQYTSRGDLFRPRFATSEPVVTNNNDVAIVWYEVNDAVGYTVQLCNDTYYKSLYKEYTIEGSENCFISLEDLPYASHWWVRVRSNAADPIHNSQWACTEISTEGRPAYAHLLMNVDAADIHDTEALIKWEVDPENPVTYIKIESTADAEAAPIGGDLTAAEMAAGQYLAKGLSPNTRYKVNIYDMNKTRVQDQPYNQVKFKTTGPQPDPILVGFSDDFSTLLFNNNEDPSVPDGMVYILPESSVYTISPFAMKKGFTIKAEEGATVKPHVIMNGTFSAFSGATIGEFRMENIKISNKMDLQYFFNAANSYEMEEVNMINVDFIDVRRGFWRHQSTNSKHIGIFNIIGCLFDQCGNQGSGYGTFAIASAGKGVVGLYDAIDEMVIRNTTFMRDGYLNDTTFGWANVLDYSTTANPIDLTIENVTFYEFCHDKPMISITNTENSKVTVRNLVVASPCGAFLTEGSGTVTEFSNNYATKDYALGAASFGGKDVKLKAVDLFVDAKNGDLHFKDDSSIIYQNRAGDPRWLE